MIMIIDIKPYICYGNFNGFYLQSVAKYLRLTLVSMWNSAPRENFNGYFSDFFANTNKKNILAGVLALGYHSMKFRHFPNIS